MFLIFGLGNPGKRYQWTRHNIGFLMVDYLAEKYHIDVSTQKLNGIFGETKIGGLQTLLIKPQTFMNLSGKSVSEFAHFYKVPSRQIFVIHDDLDLGWGDIRIKAEGGTAGHHGLDSIVSQLGTDEFQRIRFGIGRPKDPAKDIVEYVLSPLTEEEKATLPGLFRQGNELLEKILAGFS